MKKIILLSIILSLSLTVSAETWSMTITNSTRCIPVRDPVGLGKDVTAWTNNISTTAGTYYTNTSGTAYMAVTAGTSTNEPTFSSGGNINSTDDAVTWFKCSGLRWPRGITVCVNSGNEVYWNRNSAATTNSPWTIKKLIENENASDYHFISGGTSTVAFATE